MLPKIDNLEKYHYLNIKTAGKITTTNRNTDFKLKEKIKEKPEIVEGFLNKCEKGKLSLIFIYLIQLFRII